jgi:hypothetical protein
MFGLLLLYPVITFIQGVYNYIPKTNHVSRVHSLTAVLYLQFVLHVMLFRPCKYVWFIITIIIIRRAKVKPECFETQEE